jgi:REP element-mobilizing transposase RayT
MHAVVGITPQAGDSGLRFRFKNTGFAHLIYRPHSHQWQINSLNNRTHWNEKDTD